MKHEHKLAASDRYWLQRGDAFADFYRTWNPLHLPNRLFCYQRQKLVFDFLGDASWKVCADVGCGSGELISDLGKRCQRLLGIDYSQVMLERARASRDPHVSLLRADCRGLPVKANCVDMVFALGLLDYVDDVRAVLSEIGRILVADGEAIVTVPKSPSLLAPLRWTQSIRERVLDLPPIVNSLDRRSFLDLLGGLGFEVRRLESLWTTMWIAHLAKAHPA